MMFNPYNKEIVKIVIQSNFVFAEDAWKGPKHILSNAG